MALSPVCRALFAPAVLLVALVSSGCSGGGGGGSSPPPASSAPAAPVATAVAGDQQVTAVSGEGLESADSLQVSAVPHASYAPPPAPVAVPRTQSVLLDVPYPPPQPYVSLDLYWSTTAGVTKATGTRIAGVTGPYEHTGLERGQTYHYVLVGILPDGRSSAESAEVSAAVPFTTTFSRLDSAGARSWWHGVNDAVGLSVAARPDGSFYVAGLTYGPATFGAGEPGETTLRPSTTSGQLFVARYTADGRLAWVQGSDGGLVGGRQGEAVAAAVLADGSVAVTGSYLGHVTLAPGTPGATMLPQLSIDGDVFVARFLSDGTLAWARAAGGQVSPFAGGHEGRAAVGLSDGSVVVTGSFFGAITFAASPAPDVTLFTTAGCNTNDFDVFLARYDASGLLSWARRAGGCSWEEGLGIAASPTDELSVTGRFDSRPAVFGPGEPGETSLSAELLDYITYDVFVARYHPDGALAWADRAGGVAEDVGEGVAATGGGVTVSGQLRGSALFGGGTPAATTLPAGAFLARWSDAGSFVWGRSIDLGDYTYPTAVAAAPAGDAWLVGTLPGPGTPVVLGPGEPGETTLLAGQLDLFAARYGPDGSLRAAAALDRGPQRSRDAAGLPDGSVIVLGNVAGY